MDIYLNVHAYAQMQLSLVKRGKSLATSYPADLSFTTSQVTPPCQVDRTFDPV